MFTLFVYGDECILSYSTPKDHSGIQAQQENYMELITWE